MDVPAFPLQILLRREPGWAGLPVVVVAKDEPQGRVLWANEEARRERVLPGQRYAAALSLARDLRAGVVPEEEIRSGVDEVAARLRRFTPVVDPSRDEPGVFRLDAAGLSHLYPDLRAWADAMGADLAAAGLRACVVVGWTEFGAYAVARALATRLLPATGRGPPPNASESTAAPPTAGATTGAVAGRNARAAVGANAGAPAGARDASGSAAPNAGANVQGAAPAGDASRDRTVPRIVFADDAAERRALRRVPLERLLDRALDGGSDRGGGGTSEARDLLAKLGVRTVEDFLALPAAALGERLGGAVRRLHDLASGEARDLLRPAPCDEPVRSSVVLEHPESDGTRLLFIVKRLLDPLLFRTAERRELLAGVELRLRFDEGPSTARRAAAADAGAAHDDGAEPAAGDDDNDDDDVEPGTGAVRSAGAGVGEWIGAGARPGLSGAGAPVPRAAPWRGGARRAPPDGGTPDPGGSHAELTEVVRPAVPTLDALQILDLVRLRLESLQLRSGATEVVLTAQGVPATPAQLALFTEKPKRDLAAADRALARLRAEFGEDAVVRAQLREGHLPEASYAWERLLHAQLPRVREPPSVTRPPPTSASPRPAMSIAPTPEALSGSSPSPRPPTSGHVPGLPLVRRIFARPIPLPPRPRHEPDGWMLRGFEHGNVVRLEGPFVVAGGWWGGEEVRREFHFAETARGRLFWIFYDVRRRRWFLQGEVS